MRRRRGTVAAGAVAVVLLIAGVTVLATAGESASFGWFAYAPLSEATFTGAFPGVMVWSRQEAVGAALVVLAVFVAAATGGYALGRRRALRR